MSLFNIFFMPRSVKDSLCSNAAAVCSVLWKSSESQDSIYGHVATDLHKSVASKQIRQESLCHKLPICYISVRLLLSCDSDWTAAAITHRRTK